MIKGVIIAIVLALANWFKKKQLNAVKQTSIQSEVSNQPSTIQEVNKPVQDNKVEVVEEVKPVEVKPIEVKPDKVEFDKVEQVKIIKKSLDSSQIMGSRNAIIKQIILHHTAGSSAKGALDWWNNTSDKVGTNYVIDKDGTVYQAFEDKYWAYQLGIRSSDNEIPIKYKTKGWSDLIERQAIGIELACEGELVEKNDKFWFEDGQRYIDENLVYTLNKPYKGYKHYVKYTDAQIKSLEQLLVKLCETYSIPKKWVGTFIVSVEALDGEKGIFSHVNYRTSGKTDLYPYPPIINMLNNLK